MIIERNVAIIYSWLFLLHTYRLFICILMATDDGEWTVRVEGRLKEQCKQEEYFTF